MSSIFCLETEWDNSVHDMKKESSVRPLLQYLETPRLNIESVFRQVATLEEFKYYLNHLTYPTYQRFNVIYLCFHGSKGEISFADGQTYSLQEMAEDYPGIFNDRIVHFGSCSTLKEDEELIEDFKRATGAKLVTGYKKNVGFHSSFLFELWLMYVVSSYTSIGPQRLKAKVNKEMKYFSDELSLRIY